VARIARNAHRRLCREMLIRDVMSRSMSGNGAQSSADRFLSSILEQPIAASRHWRCTWPRTRPVRSAGQVLLDRPHHSNVPSSSSRSMPADHGSIPDSWARAVEAGDDVDLVFSGSGSAPDDSAGDPRPFQAFSRSRTPARVVVDQLSTVVLISFA